MRFINKLVIGCCLPFSQVVHSHGPKPFPLVNVEPPPVPGLIDGPDPIVVNEDIAIALGKALFWDMNVGSDGMACASCHFHAGADRRVKNQINPGDKSTNPTGVTFGSTAAGDLGPNYTLSIADFPLHQYNNPLDQNSGATFSTDDAVTSGGTFSGEFSGASRFTDMDDECNRSADPVFHVNNIGTRRVEPRNAPTVINAVFNHRNFWDGRANNIFNGSSNWGDRDPNAGVWVKINRRTVEKQRLHLINSSLASQALATIFSVTEMACNNRNIADLGRKLLYRQPLQYQNVHHEDSVFAPLGLAFSTTSELKPGLNTTYSILIKQAFANKYWSYRRRGAFGSRAGQIPYNQMEANFSLFFGIALQMYQATLISDQAPIDTTPIIKNKPTVEGLGSEATVRGFVQFETQHCNMCHSGSLTTRAAVTANAMILTNNPLAFGPNSFDARLSDYINVVDRDSIGSAPKLVDTGFANTGVADPNNDPGIGALDDFGNPLSFAEQYVQHLAGNSQKVLDPSVPSIRTCEFKSALAFNLDIPNDVTFHSLDDITPDPKSQDCTAQPSFLTYIPTHEEAAANLSSPKMATSTKAVFKIPSLRNIELTGPYMHNGSMATLEQVLEFYARGGNFPNNNQHGLITGIPVSNNSTVLTDIIAFLKTLTDERVRYERAPFDHPEIRIPHGHQGDAEFVTSGNPLEATLAKDEFLTIPAVGANGSVEPLPPFESFLAQ